MLDPLIRLMLCRLNNRGPSFLIRPAPHWIFFTHNHLRSLAWDWGHWKEIMHNYNRLIALLKSTCGHSHILSIPRPFLDFTGSFEAALLLSQIIYWSDRGQDPDGWFYKTYAQWQAEIGLSEYHVRKSSKILVKLGLLETRVKRAPAGSPTVHYRLDWPNFSESFVHFFQEGTLKNFRIESERISETLNTKTTTETTNKKEGAAVAAPPLIYMLKKESKAGKKASAQKISGSPVRVGLSNLNLLGCKRRFYSRRPLTGAGFLVVSRSQTRFRAKRRERSPPPPETIWTLKIENGPAKSYARVKNR